MKKLLFVLLLFVLGCKNPVSPVINRDYYLDNSIIGKWFENNDTLTINGDSTYSLKNADSCGGFWNCCNDTVYFYGMEESKARYSLSKDTLYIGVIVDHGSFNLVFEHSYIKGRP